MTGWRPRTVTEEPYNAETPPAALVPRLTPVDAFFVRDHFGVPTIDPATWRLTVDGAVDRPYRLSHRELLALADREGAREVEVVLECAGNGRALMEPRPPGVPWGEHAVGCARFAGVPLAAVLGPAGVRAEAVELVFTGADSGEVDGRDTPFERALPVAAALHPDTLLATRMNGEPLTRRHGAPVRLVVPGRYGVAGVKWLVGVRAVVEPFNGPFQGGSYVYRESRGTPEGPVAELRVRALLTEPAPGAPLRAGEENVLRGRAWSGGGAAVVRVEVRIDRGEWRAADLEAPGGPYGWTPWSLRWTPGTTGVHTVTVRATDAEGRTQPLTAPWNAGGYGCNPAARRELEVH
ncbi:sulfite oxidase [Kitasatospora camelliae]|uniref:Sulfite oxidase n=1 Tax=Kitasatospora camelliae TaxID=3156397 RepID=A0AAU8K3A7_9ACTN